MEQYDINVWGEGDCRVIRLRSWVGCRVYKRVALTPKRLYNGQRWANCCWCRVRTTSRKKLLLVDLTWVIFKEWPFYLWMHVFVFCINWMWSSCHSLIRLRSLFYLEKKKKKKHPIRGLLFQIPCWIADLGWGALNSPIEPWRPWLVSIGHHLAPDQ